MKLYPITIPAEGWKSDSSISYPYYIDIQISGIKESDCIAVTISPEDIDVAKAAYFTTTEAKNNVLRLRARKIPTKQISASYYFIREDILMAFGPVSIGGSSYVLPPATADTLGGVMIGDGLAVDETGKAAFAPAAMTTPTAKALGTKLAGEGLTVDENGKINLNETGALTSYPVGSIYQSTSSTSPAALFGGSWQEIAQNRVLMGASYTHAAGTTVEAGLPNITGSFVANVRINRHAVSGAFTAGNNLTMTGADNSDANVYKFSLDASKSNAIYGRSSTVQPAAYYVHIWRRVA
nr:MAG TPA: baseplate protein [Caudoviricetes sp.]